MDGWMDEEVNQPDQDGGGAPDLLWNPGVPGLDGRSRTHGPLRPAASLSSTTTVPTTSKTALNYRTTRAHLHLAFTLKVIQCCFQSWLWDVRSGAPVNVLGYSRLIDEAPEHISSGPPESRFQEDAYSTP